MLQKPEEEQCELRNEDEHAGLVQALEAYMQLYETLRAECPETISIFWEAWWRALAGLLPEKEWCWNYETHIYEEVIDEVLDPESADEANEEDDSSIRGHCLWPDEDLIRSRIEFFVGGGGMAFLAEDIFSDDIFSDDIFSDDESDYPEDFSG